MLRDREYRRELSRSTQKGAVIAWIAMWIHVVRPWTPDPMSFDLGGEEGIFIFTDRGGDRIERAVFAGGIGEVYRAARSVGRRR